MSMVMTVIVYIVGAIYLVIIGLLVYHGISGRPASLPRCLRLVQRPRRHPKN